MKNPYEIRNPVLYGLARMGLLFGLNAFALSITNIVVIGAVGTLLPKFELYNRPMLLSFIGWAIVLIVMSLIFADDAKRHTAYGEYSIVDTSITVILISAVYYIPVLLIKYITDRRVEDGFRFFYSTNDWLSPVSSDITVYALIGIIIQAIIFILVYGVSHKRYLKKL